jgi:hypothetical protein
MGRSSHAALHVVKMVTLNYARVATCKLEQGKKIPLTHERDPKLIELVGITVLYVKCMQTLTLRKIIYWLGP